jgi:hypothetical protein
MGVATLQGSVMPVDDATRRLALVLQHELRRLVERERIRTDREEEVRFDPVSRIATWETRRGDVIGRWFGEVVARYSSVERRLWWEWATRPGAGPHTVVVPQEGNARGAPQLAMPIVEDLDEADAATLARLAVLVARGEGIVASPRSAAGEIVFIGLFDAPRPRDGEPRDPSRYSVPPPPVVERRPASGSTPPPPVRTLAAIRELYTPRNAPRPPDAPLAAPLGAPSDGPVRAPSRALFTPLATSVLAALSRSAGAYQQALFVVTVGAARVPIVSLAAVDGAGILLSLDPPAELVDAAARMIDADRGDGNGTWRKLAARIVPKADGGATLHVDVI